MITHYKELVVWQKAMDLVEEVYHITKELPDTEKFGLISQLRRSAVSIPCNIAEGQGRLTKGEFKQFLGHSRGSLFELETQLLITNKFHKINKQRIAHIYQLIEDVGRLLNGLLRSLG